MTIRLQAIAVRRWQSGVRIPVGKIRWSGARPAPLLACLLLITSQLGCDRGGRSALEIPDQKPLTETPTPGIDSSQEYSSGDGAGVLPDQSPPAGTDSEAAAPGMPPLPDQPVGDELTRELDADDGADGEDAPRGPIDRAGELIDSGLIDPGWKRMDPIQEVWLDPVKKRVIVGGTICFREGLLEMFACPRGTKEHESIVAVHGSARLVHACLIALGIEPGKPASWDPEYQAVSGPRIRVEVKWIEGNERKACDAREMIVNAASREPLQTDWVFGGSRVFTEAATGETFYCGDSGEFICVSNFSTATLDLPIESSESAASLMFMANPDRIPPLGTRVILSLSLADDAASQPGAGSAGQ